MSKKHFSILLLATLIAAAAVLLLLPSRTGRDETAGGGLFIEGLASRVNDVDRVVITGGGGSPVTTLERGEDGWRIGELSGYPADWGKLKGVLAGLSQAVVVEAKTANPGYYDRLGVEDPSSEGAQGLLLEVFAGERIAAVIAGNDAAGRGGQYLRLADREQSVLADRSLDASAEPLDWADDELLDVGSAQIAELEITHADGERVSISKVSADDSDFTLAGIPEEREIKSSWTVNSLANVFSLLRMEGVAKDDGSPGGEPVRIRALTFSGLEIQAEAFQHEGETWLRLRAESRAATESGDGTEPAVGDGAAVEAAEIMRRTSGWDIRIADTKLQAMTRRMDDLLKTTDDEAGT